MKIRYLISAIPVFAKHIFYLLWQKNIDIPTLQFNKYKELVDYAWKNIPAYRHLWESKGFDPSMLQSLEDVNRIPVIDKEFVRKNCNDMVSIIYDRNRLSLVTTGGTTGMPMKFFIDQYSARAKELAYKVYNFAKYWNIRLYLDRVVVMKGRCLSEKLIKQGVFWEKIPYDNGIYLSSFHICEENYETYLSKLREFKPKYIKAYPSSIVAFCLLMKKHLDKGMPGLKGIICSSENIFKWHREIVKETLGVPIFSYYGHSEKAVSAYENSHSIMEFQPLYSYVEFAEVNGVQANIQSLAKVFVTSFDNLYFPFIRYDTNDYIEPCSCKLPGMKCARQIIGREQEFVLAANGDHVIFTCNDEVVWGIDGIQAYQYEQYKRGELVLNLQVDEAFDFNYSMPIIKSRLCVFFNGINTEIKIVDNISKTKSGKFRYFIQDVE